MPTLLKVRGTLCSLIAAETSGEEKKGRKARSSFAARRRERYWRTRHGCIDTGRPLPLANLPRFVQLIVLALPQAQIGGASVITLFETELTILFTSRK